MENLRVYGHNCFMQKGIAPCLLVTKSNPPSGGLLKKDTASTAQATYTVDPSGYNLKKAQGLKNDGTRQNHDSFVNTLSSWLARARKSHMGGSANNRNPPCIALQLLKEPANPTAHISTRQAPHLQKNSPARGTLQTPTRWHPFC